MTRLTHQACTSVLVGKTAALAGSPLIARNEDNAVAIWPKHTIVVPAQVNIPKTYVSKGNHFTTELPTQGVQYTAVPDNDPSAGDYAESGINAHNVAMSATESAYTNSRILGIDPLIATGIAEDAMVTVVLPYIDSAQAGIRRLGQLVTTHGAAETNGVLFSDLNEVWYMEIVSGHHWVAQRIPDDGYAVVANQLAIQDVDFHSPNFLTSPNIQSFVQTHHLNPDGNRFNSRHIFGTHSRQDAHYNTPRVWFGHHLLTPSAYEEPDSMELPFIQHAERKIGLDDIAAVLGSHYAETPYDPVGTGSAIDRHRFRAIGLARTENSHILQLRRDVTPNLAGIVWQAFGNPAFNPYVPFYASADQLAPAYGQTSLDYRADNPYWQAKLLEVLSEDHYALNQGRANDFLKAIQSLGIARLAAGDALEHPTPSDLGRFNVTTAATFATHLQTQIGQLVAANAEASALSFNMDSHL